MILFITHPDVVIDPAVPVPDWPLSPEGLRRMTVALAQPWLAGVTALFTSAERKATDAAALVADRFGLAPTVIPALGENDRSATGYLPRPEFEATADRFFAQPDASIRGWERAADAQARIVAAMAQVAAQAPAKGDTAVISHGGVGALLHAHLRRVPISRAEDQPGPAGGNVFSISRDGRTLLSGWRAIDA